MIYVFTSVINEYDSPSAFVDWVLEGPSPFDLQKHQREFTQSIQRMMPPQPQLKEFPTREEFTEHQLQVSRWQSAKVKILREVAQNLGCLPRLAKAIHESSSEWLVLKMLADRDLIVNHGFTEIEHEHVED